MGSSDVICHRAQMNLCNKSDCPCVKAHEPDTKGSCLKMRECKPHGHTVRTKCYPVPLACLDNKEADNG